MTTLQKIAVGVVAILAVLGGIAFLKLLLVNNGVKVGATTFQQGEVQNNPFIFINGFSAGSSQQFGVDVNGNFNTSGTVTVSGGLLKTNTNSTSTSATSQTLAASDVKGYDTVIVTPTVGSDIMTFFASSTAATWLPTVGNSQTTCFINGTTTAGINLTFAGGTGLIVQVASSSVTALGSLNLGPQKEGCFTFTRANSTATTFDILAAYTAFK